MWKEKNLFPRKRPEHIEGLRADSGLRAFARLPEYEHQLLLNIAKRPDCALTLAYTPAGKIVGQVTIAPCEGWIHLIFFGHFERL